MIFTEWLDALGSGLFLLLEPHRLLLLWAGVLFGLALGLLPGVGGLAGTALLLPFTFKMDPAAAMALLLGLAATTTHGDPISAILLGAPGHSASAATALDGYPMTKRGEGARALGAAYMSALMGGLFGAVLMAVALPIVRPAILYIGSPELLALSVVGISMVSVLSGNTPLRGLTAACVGVMLAMIGSAPQSGILRWTMGTLYLWNGLPLVPITLGIFALPELCDLLIGRTAITAPKDNSSSNWSGLKQGSIDCFSHWWLVLRCSWIGSVIGAIPGISASVIDWISYGHALRTEKGARQSFGHGDVRGVIAAESATCSREGGALIPTIVFGVPGSAGMALLLGAFLIQGLNPGPDMLVKNLNITYSMVWSIAIANVLGSGLCYIFSNQFAKIATLRYTLILPVVLCLVYVGAFEGTRSWGDLYALLIFGVVGWAMKHFKWPRPPLVLGFILGAPIERYLFVSITRYDFDWLLNPIVIVLFAFVIYTILGPLVRSVVQRRRKARSALTADAMPLSFGSPRFTLPMFFPAFVIGVVVVMVFQATQWNVSARIVPLIVGCGALLFCSLSLFDDLFGRRAPAVTQPSSDIPHSMDEAMHMDVISTVTHLGPRIILVRGAIFFGWLIAFLISMSVIGLIPTVPIFVAAFMRIEGSEPWRIIMPMAICITGLIYIVFDQLLAVPWPATFLGDLLPNLKDYVPSL